MENLKTVLLAILVAAVIIGAGYVVSVQTQERSAPKPYGPAIWTCLFYFDGDSCCIFYTVQIMKECFNFTQFNPIAHIFDLFIPPPDKDKITV